MDNHFHVFTNIKYISFFFFFSIITTFFPQQSKSAYDYSTCRDIKNSYSCGNITNISYPFWGQNGDRNCSAGKPFYLNCNKDNVTTIQLSSQNFTVLDINTTAYTMKLKRTDLTKNLCSPQFVDTNLSLPLFQYPQNVNKRITIYYNCTPSPYLLPKYNLCGSQNPSFGRFGDEDEMLKNCNKHIQVPAAEEDFPFPKEDDYHVFFERGVLEKGLDKGFEVEYIVEDKECFKCLGSGEGDCEWKNNNDIEKHVKSSCYFENCPNGSIAHSSHCHKSQSSKKTLIIGVVSAMFVVLVLIIGIYFYRRKKNIRYAKSYVQSRSLSTDPSSKDLERGSQYFGGSQNLGVQHFTYTELEEATNYFDPTKELGEGGFGTVYFGKLYDGRSVAVKRLYENNYKRVEQFMNEVKLLAGLVHPNLVSLYGCTSRHSRELLLVYEYVSNGTVADHLHGKQTKHGKLSWPIRMNIAVETASALKYLHISDIIHRDIKTNNILLDAHFRVKVADFGLSRLFPYDQTHVSTAPQGTPGYVDPDYHQCYQLTDKSDVYSFGVVMIELISSLPAVDITRHRHEINLANMAINRIQNQALHEIVDPTLSYESDPKVKKMINAIGELAFQCLQSSKELRPCMDDVLETLLDIQSDGKHKSKPEVMDISSLADDVVLLNHDPPPLSPDSNLGSNYTTPNTSG
ncbi:LEAF RUST 10 DISEASE-RESISTANCE LOCUS RECEPTOR-LIKE PROTEIN KINASE-like 1.4 isoform X4 [Trifolium pratense]|uniref:LEAF RUST 10 DISEASE-RESISTANCE LOCUS RECEPTOR-LIKE PROTEIN KINASE-like 1.4 isoform X4 n=1 Tax=Trifolium pratense TaxID=57577 RepID=UPI001E698342|nr:LEAF RUST 10 DISEASE-RESISTANCE LOCUS RECEPTOR-LIKE PROTEIN KINASE-like 1.4 isoform X4 [Trifolium pratense]